MDLKELYAKKGELVTTIEVSQAQLRVVDQQIVEILNKQNAQKEETSVNA